ncbi:restriction endonuclease [Corynebacterium sp. S7]
MNHQTNLESKVMVSFTAQGMPTHQELVVPILRALDKMGGSASSRDLVTEVADNLPNSETLLEITYPNRPSTSVLENRIAFGRSTAKRIGALEQPNRGMNLITKFGEQLLELAESEALTEVKRIDREKHKEYNRNRKQSSKDSNTTAVEEPMNDDADEINSDEETITSWREQLLNRLHKLSPDGFEKFVIYLLKQYDLKLTHIGGTGDEGIDAIGTAPLSEVLSSRVAVQVKRYDPNGKPIGREPVALFQRDAMTRGAERAIMVTLSRYTDAARKAATDASPTVDLIDGHRLAELIAKDGNSGVHLAPVVDEEWFNRFD